MSGGGRSGMSLESVATMRRESTRTEAAASKGTARMSTQPSNRDDAFGHRSWCCNHCGVLRALCPSTPRHDHRSPFVWWQCAHLALPLSLLLSSVLAAQRASVCVEASVFLPPACSRLAPPPRSPACCAQWYCSALCSLSLLFPRLRSHAPSTSHSTTRRRRSEWPIECASQLAL